MTPEVFPVKPFSDGAQYALCGLFSPETRVVMQAFAKENQLPIFIPEPGSPHVLYDGFSITIPEGGFVDIRFTDSKQFGELMEAIKFARAHSPPPTS